MYQEANILHSPTHTSRGWGQGRVGHGSEEQESYPSSRTTRAGLSHPILPSGPSSCPSPQVARSSLPEVSSQTSRTLRYITRRGSICGSQSLPRRLFQRGRRWRKLEFSLKSKRPVCFRAALPAQSVGAQGLVALWRVDPSSPTRDQACIPGIGRQFFNFWTTREVLKMLDFDPQKPSYAKLLQSCLTLQFCGL